MVALEVALARPDAVRDGDADRGTGRDRADGRRLEPPPGRRSSTGSALDGLALARQLAMTTYRSEADFEERFGRDVEPDGRPSIVSYLDHQGRKLVERFDPATYRILAGAMDRHDIGAGVGRPSTRRSPGWPTVGTRLTGVGIEDDILYGPRQVHALVDDALAAPASTRATARSDSTKGHDAFLVEWDQLTAILREGLEPS